MFWHQNIVPSVHLSTPNLNGQALQAEDVDVIGLESFVSNDIAEHLPWSALQEWRWKKEVHINIKETSAFGG